MNITRTIEEYAEIINMPRPEPKFHRRMAIKKRAAQFVPFAALTGYDEVVRQTAKAHEETIDY